MSVFEQIKEGDRIVIGEYIRGFGRGTNPLKIETVTKVTATQITAGGIRFLKSNGRQTPKVYNQARVITVWTSHQGERLMTPEEAEARNKETKRELAHKALAYRIRDVKFTELPYETLLKLAEALGIEVADDPQT